MVKVAVIWVDEATATFDAVTPLPFTLTDAPAANPVPVIVTGTTAPCAPRFGATEVTVTEAVMVKVRAPDVPPPGAGLTTVTGTEPAVVRSLAGMLAVSWVVLTKVVVRGLPLHCTTDAAMKLVAVTVRSKPGPPCAALLGVNAYTMVFRSEAVMVKVRAFETPPPGAGLSTVMGAEPAVVRSLPGMLTVSWVALTKVVVRGLPFHCTTDAAMKLVPVTVRVKPGPACAGTRGASAVCAGTGVTVVMVK